MRLGKTALAHFGTQVVTSVAGFAATWVIAVILGADALGGYTVMVSLGFFWLAIPTKAVGTAVTKRMSEGVDTGPFFGAGAVLNGLLGILLGGSVLMGGELLSRFVSADGNAFLAVVTEFNVEIALLVAGTATYQTVISGLQGQKQVARSGGLKAIERITRSIALISLVAASYGIGALVLGHAVSLFVVALLGIAVFARIRPRIPNRDHLASILEFARFGWMSTLSSHTFGWMDTFVLSLFIGTTLIGVYEAAWGIASLLGMFGMSIRQTLFPEVSDLSSDGNLDRVRHYLDEGIAFGGIIVIPGLVGAIVMGERVLRFYRPEFAQGALVLVILVATYALDVYGSQFVDAINGIDRPDVTYRLNALFVGSNVGLNLVLVPTVGWVGAAIATLLSTALRTVLAYRAIDDVLDGAPLPATVIGSQVIASLVMAVGLAPVLHVSPAGRIWTITLVATGAGIYGLALIALSGRVRRKVRMVSPIANL